MQFYLGWSSQSRKYSHVLIKPLHQGSYKRNIYKNAINIFILKSIQMLQNDLLVCVLSQNLKLLTPVSLRQTHHCFSLDGVVYKDVQLNCSTLSIANKGNTSDWNWHLSPFIIDNTWVDVCVVWYYWISKAFLRQVDFLFCLPLA